MTKKVVPMNRRQRLAPKEKLNYGFDLADILSPLFLPLDVLLELGSLTELHRFQEE